MATARKASPQDIDRLLGRAVADVIVESELRKLLRSGKQLRIKQGFDPSAPDIHLGHMVGLRKLRIFQELGHKVVIIIGDWTARIGDPSDASATRKMLSAEEVDANAETYLEQFGKVASREDVDIVRQSEWFGKFDLADVIRLTSRFTVAQMLAREDFNNRFQANRPIAITEFLYPLLQAQDSVVIEADVEIGGTDQTFNMLMGRELQAKVGQTPQQVITMPMLVGTDGAQKMSKSLSNYIGVAEPPEVIYGKTMSIRDEQIAIHFELLTDVPMEEITEFRRQIEAGSVNPMELKKRLAADLVTQLCGKKAAAAAAAHFVRTVQNKETPDDVPTVSVSGGNQDIRRLLVDNNLAGSMAAAARLVKQGAVKVDGEKVTGFNPQLKDGSVVQVGKLKFVKVAYPGAGTHS